MEASENEAKNLSSKLSDYSALFSEGLGEIKGIKAKLYLKEGEKPKFFRACQVPYAIRDQVAKEIYRQVHWGILEPVKFSHWGTLVVPIKNKDGSIHLWGDYIINVNRETIAETYPLPKMDDLLVSLSGGAAF